MLVNCLQPESESSGVCCFCVHPSRPSFARPSLSLPLFSSLSCAFKSTMLPAWNSGTESTCTSSFVIDLCYLNKIPFAISRSAWSDFGLRLRWWTGIYPDWRSLRLIASKKKESAPLVGSLSDRIPTASDNLRTSDGLWQKETPTECFETQSKCRFEKFIDLVQFLFYLFKQCLGVIPSMSPVIAWELSSLSRPPSGTSQGSVSLFGYFLGTSAIHRTLKSSAWKWTMSTTVSKRTLSPWNKKQWLTVSRPKWQHMDT